MPGAELAGTWINWSETGEGASTLLIHCALAQSGAWAPVMNALDDRRLVAVDLPGHGSSGDWDPRRECTDQALAAAEALLDRLPGNVDLIGHSFGGVIALRLALARPDRIRALVLIEPVLFAAAREHAPEAFEAFLTASHAEQAAYDRQSWADAAELFYSRWSGGAAWRRLSDTQRADVIERIPLIPRTHDALVEDVHGIVPQLSTLSCPVLLLSGDRSPAIVATVMAALAQRLPRATHRVVIGAGHMLPLTHPQVVARAIETFTGALGADQASVCAGSIR